MLCLAEGESAGSALAENLRRAREAALTDVEGNATAATLPAGGAVATGAVKAQAVVWMPRPSKTETAGISNPTSLP